MLKMGSLMLDNALVHELIIGRTYYDRKEKKDLWVWEFNELIHTLTPEEFNGRFEVSGILPNKQLVYGSPTKKEGVDNDSSTARITYTLRT